MHMSHPPKEPSLSYLLQLPRPCVTALTPPHPILLMGLGQLMSSPSIAVWKNGSLSGSSADGLNVILAVMLMLPGTQPTSPPCWATPSSFSSPRVPVTLSHLLLTATVWGSVSSPFRACHSTNCLCCSGFPRPWFDSPHPELRLGHWCCPSTLLFRGCTHFKISPKFWVFLALLGIFFLITFTKWKPWFRLTANPNSPQPCRVWMQAPHRKQATHLTLTSPDSQELVGKIIILIFIEVKHHILHRNAKILIVLVDFYKSEAAVTNPHHNKPHKQEGLPQHGCLQCPHWELRMHALVERWRSCRWWCQSTQPRPPEAPRC